MSDIEAAIESLQADVNALCMEVDDLTTRLERLEKPLLDPSEASEGPFVPASKQRP